MASQKTSHRQKSRKAFARYEDRAVLWGAARSMGVPFGRGCHAVRWTHCLQPRCARICSAPPSGQQSPLLGAALGPWASPAQDTSILQGLFWGRLRTNILSPEPAPQFAKRVCDPAAQTTDLSVLFPSRDRFTEVRAHSNGIGFALPISLTFGGGGQPKKYLKAVRGSEGRRKYYVFIVQVWFSHWLQRPAVSYMVKILIWKSFMMY